MSTSEDYFLTLKTPRDRIALSFGVDVNSGSTDQLFIADADLGALATLVKLLVDKGVVTDADVQSALTNGSTGADGSVWTDLVTPPLGVTFDLFGESSGVEGFEFPVNGETLDDVNTWFVRGQVGSSMLSSFGTMTCDSSTHNGGNKSAKTHTVGGYSRALRTDTYTDASTVYVRFYFRATAAPATGLCRIFSFQKTPNAGTDPGAAIRADLAIDATGKPTMFDNATQNAPTTASNICTGAWQRVEFGLYGATMEAKFFLGTNFQGLVPDISWTAAYTSGPMNSALMGQPLSTLSSVQSWDCWHDDISFSTAGFIGP